MYDTQIDWFALALHQIIKDENLPLDTGFKALQWFIRDGSREI
jgi:hypothetical protein